MTLFDISQLNDIILFNKFLVKKYQTISKQSNAINTITKYNALKPIYLITAIQITLTESKALNINFILYSLKFVEQINWKCFQLFLLSALCLYAIDILH